MKTANDSIREDRENYIDGMELHLVNAMKLAGEVAMGISMDSLRPEILEELSMGLVCVRNLKDLEAKQFEIIMNKVHEAMREHKGAERQGAYEKHARKWDEVEAYVRSHGQVIVERNFLEEALEASAEVLQRLPWVLDEDGTLASNAVEIFAKLRLMLPSEVATIGDIDTSDNEQAAE